MVMNTRTAGRGDVPFIERRSYRAGRVALPADKAIELGEALKKTGQRALTEEAPET
jgi:hypothetical protein